MCRWVVCDLPNIGVRLGAHSSWRPGDTLRAFTISKREIDFPFHF